MSYFAQDQKTVFELAKEQFGDNINLNEGSDFYFLYTSMAKVSDLTKKYTLETLARLSLYSASGSYLDDLGYINNMIRPIDRFYVNLELTITELSSAIYPIFLESGFQVSFTNDEDQTLYFQTNQRYEITDGTVTTLPIEVEYIDYVMNYTVPTIPSGTPFVVYTLTGGIGGGSVSSAQSTSDATPSYVSDSDYIKIISSAKELSGGGVLSNIIAKIQQLPFVRKAFALGNNSPNGSDVIVYGKSGNYTIGKNQLLVVVDYLVTPPPQTDVFTPAIYNTTGQSIYLSSQFFGTFITSPITPITTYYTAINGQTFDVNFFVPSETDVVIVVYISSKNKDGITDQIHSDLEQKTKDYIRNASISGVFYASVISSFFDDYNLTVAKITINASVLEYVESKFDEYYNVTNFGITYEEFI